MKLTISRRIAIYLIMFSVAIIGFIALASKFILPEYYTSYQLRVIEDYVDFVNDVYNADAPEEAISFLEELQKQVGGEIYIQSEQGQFKGAGQGKNARSQGNGQERFIPEGPVTSYTYSNRIGLEVFALGIDVYGEYMIYEVSIQSLDDVIGVVLEFFWWILGLVLVFAVIMTLIISRSIAKPIRDLNSLALAMKDKEVQSVMVTDNNDEIGELNRSLNGLYEELLSSIYHLEGELKRERNAETLKKRFLAQATHELKTPISIIRGYAEILYDGMYRDEDDRDRYINHIYEETETISHLILDVLDYTKMETGNYRLEKSSVDARGTYMAVADRLSGFIENEGLEAKVSVDLPEDMLVSLDIQKMEQVIRNLVSNAVEHAQSTVAISVTQSDERVRIDVYNDGPKVSEEDLPYLFDSFYKKTGKRTGTGLGLAIVKQIVMLHDGDYRVENTVNGVRFVIIM